MFLNTLSQNNVILFLTIILKYFVNNKIQYRCSFIDNAMSIFICFYYYLKNKIENNFKQLVSIQIVF